MGRKSLEKNRKDNSDKKQTWARTLFPFLQENGLAKLNIDQMAAYLKKSKSTLYEYFESKEEIILLALTDKISSLEPALTILENSNLSYQERYTEFMQMISYELADVSSLFLTDLQNLFPEIWQHVQLFIQGLIDLLAGYYTGGIQSGEFKDMSIRLLWKIDELFILNILTDPNFLAKNPDMSLGDLITQYLDMKLNGFLRS